MSVQRSGGLWNLCDNSDLWDSADSADDCSLLELFAPYFASVIKRKKLEHLNLYYIINLFKFDQLHIYSKKKIYIYLVKLFN